MEGNVSTSGLIVSNFQVQLGVSVFALSRQMVINSRNDQAETLIT